MREYASGMGTASAKNLLLFALIPSVLIGCTSTVLQEGDEQVLSSTEQSGRHQAPSGSMPEEVRKKLRAKLGTVDPLQLAGEAAPWSPKIRLLKEQFEQATWEYLKSAEQSAGHPRRELETEAKGKVRAERRDALIRAVREELQ